MFTMNNALEFNICRHMILTYGNDLEKSIANALAKFVSLNDNYWGRKQHEEEIKTAHQKMIDLNFAMVQRFNN